jgi:hypothetical protein
MNGHYAKSVPHSTQHPSERRRKALKRHLPRIRHSTIQQNPAGALTARLSILLNQLHQQFEKEFSRMLESQLWENTMMFVLLDFLLHPM